MQRQTSCISTTSRGKRTAGSGFRTAKRRNGFKLCPFKRATKEAVLGWSDSEIQSLQTGKLHDKTHPWGSDSGAVDDILRESDKMVYAVVAGHVWRTADFDRDDPSWLDLTGNLPCAATFVKHTPAVILSGCEDGAYILNETSGAPVWNRFGSQLPHVPVVDIVALGDGTLLALTHGRGAWVARLPQP